MNFVYIVIIFLLFSCQNDQNKGITDICPTVFSQQVYPVSLKNLDQIKDLNGNFIQVDGILHNNFEDVALYPLGRSDSKYAAWLNLKIRSDSETQLAKMNGQRITVIGKINIAKKGHLGAYFCELDSVFCIKLTR